MLTESTGDMKNTRNKRLKTALREKRETHKEKKKKKTHSQREEKSFFLLLRSFLSPTLIPGSRDLSLLSFCLPWEKDTN